MKLFQAFLGSAYYYFSFSFTFIRKALLRCAVE